MRNTPKGVTIATVACILWVLMFAVAGSLSLDGNLIEWIEGMATAAAFLAATIAGIYAAGVFRLEEARDQRLEDAKLREQAELVASWVEIGRQDWSSGTKIECDVWLAIRNF